MNSIFAWMFIFGTLSSFFFDELRGFIHTPVRTAKKKKKRMTWHSKDMCMVLLIQFEFFSLQHRWGKGGLFFCVWHPRRVNWDGDTNRKCSSAFCLNSFSLFLFFLYVSWKKQLRFLCVFFFLVTWSGIRRRHDSFQREKWKERLWETKKKKRKRILRKNLPLDSPFEPHAKQLLIAGGAVFLIFLMNALF